jgi:TonB family protein
MCGCAVRRLCVRLGRESFSSQLAEQFFSKMKTYATATLRNFLRQGAWPGAIIFLASSFCARSWATPGPELATTVDPTEPGNPVTQHFFAERNGAFETKNGLTLHLSADLGSVRIVSLEAGAAPAVRYTVHIETDARGAVAQSLLDKYVLRAKSTKAGVDIEGALPSQAARAAAAGAQFWVQFEVAVPAGYNLDVKTDAGDIDTQDIGGTATLTTQGGNIRTGRIGVSSIRNAVHNVNDGGSGKAMSKLRTEGGHIQVQDAIGDLSAFTGGGHINVGNVTGDATLRSGGGHIRAGQIGGRAELDTDGGNITVGHAGSFVNVRTGGGQIDFGEVRGSVRAQTAGGGIRIMYVAGPMEVESSGGSICLTRVAGAVQAATADGTITAWISPDQGIEGGSDIAAAQQAMVQLAGASQLASGNGDIVVFLPRNLAANIDALVSTGGEHRIEADPALHLNFHSDHANGVGSVHAVAVLNGGGLPLKLKTTAGKIRLQYLDSDLSLRESRIREQEERLRVVNFTQPAPVAAPALPDGPAIGSQSDWLESWVGKLEVAFTGGLREDADDFRKRLTSAPHPPYPELAQRVGIQGMVKLQVRVLQDGRVEVLKLLQGEPVLADAAISTVKQWRGKPAWVNGKPVEVISTVTFNFQLK